MPNMSMHWLRWFNTVGSLLPIGLCVLLPTAGQAKVVEAVDPQTNPEFTYSDSVELNSYLELTNTELTNPNLHAEVIDAESIHAESIYTELTSIELAEIEAGAEFTESTAVETIDIDIDATDATESVDVDDVEGDAAIDSDAVEPSVEPSVDSTDPDATESSTEASTDSDPNPAATDEATSSEPDGDPGYEEATTADSEEESEPTDSVQAEADELTPEEQQRRELLMQADALYLSGNIEAAEKLYRQAKDPLWKGRGEAIQQPLALYDPNAIAPAAQVYWREGLMGLEAGLETRTLIPLRLLVEQYPEFIPGHIQLAEALQQYEQTEEALTLLDQAVALYPNEPSLIRAHAQALAEQEQWMEASIAARQFALLNQSVPEAKKFRWMANEYLDEFKSAARTNQWGSAIANVITGTISAVVTGNIFAPISGVSSAVALLQGEEQIGEQVANQARRQLPLVHDPEIVAYVDDIGQRLAQVAGRDEFEYEFEVILDDRLNAFALPGGKIFVNAGAIAETESEAELAGLLAHELAHTVLSHGFQIVTEGNLTASLAQYLPFGGTIADLLIMGYSRDMERQADVLGTQILASAGYAADGLHNLMVTLYEQEEDSPVFSWLSTHPLTDDRVEYTAEVVEERNFNRYQYEGIARHSDIQVEVRALLAKFERKIEAIEERQR
ncbi:MAG: M48 family metalloprotease [Thainema sp.]